MAVSRAATRDIAVVKLAIQKYIDIAGFLDDTPYSSVEKCQAVGKMYRVHLPVND
jgi:hypothetical protein